MAGEETRLRVWRGDAQGGEVREYRLKAQEGMVVLDALHALQASEAPDLAVRWNCKAGRCGSCSAEINGRPALLCMTRLSELPRGEPVTVLPLKTFPLIRDLVTDVSINYRKAAAVAPFTPDPAPDARLFQEDVERLQQFHNCIECFLCQNVCHVLRDHEPLRERYAGPRFFVKLASLEMNPLDTAERVDFAKEQAGIGLCNVTKCCSEVCPEHIGITDDAIIPLKERVADRHYDPLARVLGLFAARRRR